MLLLMRIQIRVLLSQTSSSSRFSRRRSLILLSQPNSLIMRRMFIAKLSGQHVIREKSSSIHTFSNMLNANIRLLHALFGYGVDLRRHPSRDWKGDDHHRKTNKRTPSQETIKKKRAKQRTQRTVDGEIKKIAGLYAGAE